MIVYFLLPATMATVWVFFGKKPQQHANKNYNKTSLMRSPLQERACESKVPDIRGEDELLRISQHLHYTTGAKPYNKLDCFKKYSKWNVTLLLNVATNEKCFLDLREVIEKKLAASQDNFHKSIILYFSEINENENSTKPCLHKVT